MPPKVVDLTTEPKIQTVSDIMTQIQADMAAARSGALRSDTARILMSGHKSLLKGVELYLQAARLESRTSPGLTKLVGGRAVVEIKKDGVA
jgi:hypothetical protein